jgi:lipopolysaccharide/colanic/teichoic acid biosynthesis glycosyltransferase
MHRLDNLDLAPLTHGRPQESVAFSVVSASDLVEMSYDELDYADTIARPTLASTTALRVVPRWELRCKRSLDVLAAVAGLVLLSPVLVVIAISIKLTSPGAVLFRQQRVGVGGELFEVKKFRTMCDGAHAEILADDELNARYRANDFKLPLDDPRITRVGGVLRRTSLDELPQLLNVLVGEMSLVGVRPILTEEVALRPRYDQALYRTLPPGMTGLWQVEGRSTVQKDDRLQLDRSYLEQWSLWQDVKILARTPAAILRTSHAH